MATDHFCFRQPQLLLFVHGRAYGRAYHRRQDGGDHPRRLDRLDRLHSPILRFFRFFLFFLFFIIVFNHDTTFFPIRIFRIVHNRLCLCTSICLRRACLVCQDLSPILSSQPRAFCSFVFLLIFLFFVFLFIVIVGSSRPYVVFNKPRVQTNSTRAVRLIVIPIANEPLFDLFVLSPLFPPFLCRLSRTTRCPTTCRLTRNCFVIFWVNPQRLTCSYMNYIWIGHRSIQTTLIRNFKVPDIVIQCQLIQDGVDGPKRAMVMRMRRWFPVVYDPLLHIQH